MVLEVRRHAVEVRADQCGEIKDKSVSIKRTAKVVKGGRRFGFSALVVSGDGRGCVGFGLGKSAEVPDAIRKGSELARKNLFRVPLRGTTVPYEVIGTFGPTKVMLKPGKPGSGVIAGSTVRAIVEAVGIGDIFTKVIGSSNPHNVLYATFDALLRMREPERFASARNSALETLGYHPW